MPRHFSPLEIVVEHETETSKNSKNPDSQNSSTNDQVEEIILSPIQLKSFIHLPKYEILKNFVLLPAKKNVWNLTRKMSIKDRFISKINFFNGKDNVDVISKINDDGDIIAIDNADKSSYFKKWGEALHNVGDSILKTPVWSQAKCTGLDWNCFPNLQRSTKIFSDESQGK